MNINTLIIGVLIILFSIGSCYAALKERAARKQAEKENREARKKAETTVEIIAEANKTKADARTGDHERDLDFMARKLHDYANK